MPPLFGSLNHAAQAASSRFMGPEPTNLGAPQTAYDPICRVWTSETWRSIVHLATRYLDSTLRPLSKHMSEPHSVTNILSEGARDRHDHYRNSALQLLQLQADALRDLAQALPDDFVAAADAIRTGQGHIITSGVGKSGHVARKIASTLASTGSKAFFLHPSDASHGELGAIAEDDICILVSKSGESLEFIDILSFAKKHGVPLIVISQVEDSSMMRAADYRLLLPEEPEACPIGTSPTTSATMAMVLGDALALVVSESRGFGRGDFKELHPGGELGKAKV